eukprot:COSAG01_NODE_16_length_40091_cov_15.728646_53_plen_110_part_00
MSIYHRNKIPSYGTEKQAAEAAGRFGVLRATVRPVDRPRQVSEHRIDRWSANYPLQENFSAENEQPGIESDHRSLQALAGESTDIQCSTPGRGQIDRDRWRTSLADVWI